MHRLELQLRFNDIDILGHLNNTVYLSLYDLGKARYMEDAGLRLPDVSAPTSVIADVHCTYLQPIHYGDRIFVETCCPEIGDKHYVLEQQLVDDAGEVRSRCRTVMVYLDPLTRRPARVPDDYREKISRYDAAEGEKR